MANAVFTIKQQAVYDNVPEERYHFPSTYLNYVKQSVGDFVVYYEPRRESADLAGRDGRQAYIGIARLTSVVPDPVRPGYYYAIMAEYATFAQPVPFKSAGQYPESALKKSDGSTNKGAFGRAVRKLPKDEFMHICRLGFVPESQSAGLSDSQLEEELKAPPDRELKTGLFKRSLRDKAFQKSVRTAYNATCVFTGIRVTNKNGAPEVEAAHIKPVKSMGPDSPRNGIPLGQTMHWLFDEGFLSLADDGKILSAKSLIPEKYRALLNKDGYMIQPADPADLPHKQFLSFHRNNIFRGD